MTVFEIRDLSQKTETGTDRILGYLFYYEQSKRFFVELLSELSEWEAPAMFFGNVKRGVYSIDSEWSMKWVRQRIIPSERQNMGSILKTNHLTEYDEYKLLVLSTGRCAQDELYIKRTDLEKLRKEILERMTKKVRDVMTMSERRAIIFFRDDSARVIDLGRLLSSKRIFENILANRDVFSRAKTSPGGNGIEWDEYHVVPAEQLYQLGERVDIRYEDLLAFAKNRMVDTSGLTEMLGVSRQYINQLVKQDRLRPVLKGSGIQVFLKADIEGGHL